MKYFLDYYSIQFIYFRSYSLFIYNPSLACRLVFLFWPMKDTEIGYFIRQLFHSSYKVLAQSSLFLKKVVWANLSKTVVSLYFHSVNSLHDFTRQWGNFTGLNGLLLNYPYIKKEDDLPRTIWCFATVYSPDITDRERRV